VHLLRKAMTTTRAVRNTRVMDGLLESVGRLGIIVVVRVKTLRGHTVHVRLRVLLSWVEGLSLWVSEVLLLVHLSRCHRRARALVAVRRVLQTLGGEGRGHATTTHRLVGKSAVGLRRLVVGLLGLETTAATAVGLEALIARLR